MAETDAFPLIPGYRFVRTLGTGGMGTVFLAEDRELERLVAVKMVTGLDARESPAARDRFVREARVMARLEHPNLVRIHRLGDHEGRPFLVMEFLRGGSLAERLRARGRMQPAEALEVVRQVAGGLAAAWARGIVHRDIKPSNILFDDSGTPRLIDFGIAEQVVRARDDDADGPLRGTPHYIAPELIEGRIADFRADIYSLGVVYFEMLTGRRPFGGDEPQQVAAEILTRAVPDPRSLRPDVPPAHQALVQSMCARRRRARPRSSADLLAAIERVRRGEGGMVRPRRRLRAAAAAGVASILAAAVWLAVERARPPGSAAGPVPASAAPVNDPPAAGDADHRVFLETFPPGATVRSGEEVLTRTPGRVEPPDHPTRLRFEKPGFEPATATWRPGDVLLTVRLRPAPLRLGPEAPPAALAAELERLRTGAFALRLSSDRASRAGVVLEIERPGFALVSYLDPTGDLLCLYPSPGHEREPADALTTTIATGPNLASVSPGGWFFAVASTRPLAPPPLPGGRPLSGARLYPRVFRHVSTVHPAHAFLEWLIEQLRGGGSEWDVAVLRSASETR